MLFLFLALCIIAFILMYCNPKEKSIIWGSMIAIAGSLGGAANVLEMDVLPHITNHRPIIDVLLFIIGLFYSLSHYVEPYACLMFGIIYSNLFSFNRRSYYILSSLLCIPIIIMYAIYPFYPKFITSYKILSSWAAPYIFLGNIILLYSFLKEQNKRIKQQRLLVILLAAPPTLFSAFANYIYPAFGIIHVYKNNVFMVILLLVLFIIFATKYGVLGVKLKFEKQSFNDTIKLISTGTSIINHTIKNEVLKISICAENIKSVIGDNPEAIEDIKIINLSTDHMLKMMARIQEKTQEIKIYDQAINLTDVVENAVVLSKPLFETKNISVEKNYSIDIAVKVDKLHIQNVLCNVFNNAVEAMKDNGALKIYLRTTENEVTISIQDSGAGISKENLAHVFEPFFSTKNQRFNYGLGLSYCYNVMQKHNGAIEILSEENKGTQVILRFPLERMANSV